MAKQLHWGIIGAGGIAGKFANGLKGSNTGVLRAVGSRSLEKAEAFAQDHGAAKAYGSYDELLADPEVEAVYIATPHPQHTEWCIRAAEAGKHILCEKPICLNAAESEAIMEAARHHGVFLMEAWMYRCHPQTAKLVELLQTKAIGEVRVIHASFAFRAGFNPEHRLFSNALGGGGILDVGSYTVSYSRLIAGASQGLPFLNPTEVVAQGVLAPTGVDLYTAATLKFEGDILSQCTTGVGIQTKNEVIIYGTEGQIHIPSPYVINRDGGDWAFTVTRGKEVETIAGTEPRPLYGIEADVVASYVGKTQEATSPHPSWEDTYGNMTTLDRWRAAIDFQYDIEKPGANWPTASRKPLKRRPDAVIPHRQIEGLDKPVSRFVMGVDNDTRLPANSVLWDDFFEQGGNTWDCAWLYKRGECERALGRWVKNRGVRDEINLLVKGAHTPHCYPDDITAQLHESLERMGVDHADIYCLHRDNFDVPVGEFVDVLNEHVEAGQIKVFGGSNWSPARIDEANAYAASKGRQGFSVTSNNFSLARMVQPIWAGCIAASEPEPRAWHVEKQFPNFAWSSQARGFFTERAGDWSANGDHTTSDAALERCWYSGDNFQRRERAFALAEHFGVLPINVAAAYVLQQPFPMFALIGPRRLRELYTTLPALTIHLTPDMLAWLNLENDTSPL